MRTKPVRHGSALGRIRDRSRCEDATAPLRRILPRHDREYTVTGRDESVEARHGRGGTAREHELERRH